MPPNKQNLEYIAKWKLENTDRIVIQPRKDLDMPDRIRQAIVAGRAASRQDYIINAVLAALERDGF